MPLILRSCNGKYNYECIEAIDVAQFNQDLEKLLAGEEVQLPTYRTKEALRIVSMRKTHRRAMN